MLVIIFAKLLDKVSIGSIILEEKSSKNQNSQNVQDNFAFDWVGSKKLALYHLSNPFKITGY